jgi:DNA-binding SARP family transcriptional activator/class 3 adenylate cyclase
LLLAAGHVSSGLLSSVRGTPAVVHGKGPGQQEGPRAVPEAGGSLLCIYLLGRFEVRCGEQVVIDSSWPRRKAATQLKLLALNKGRWLHREQIIELLWRDPEPSAAAVNFRKNLHHLRSTFAEQGLTSPVVSAATDLLAISPETWVDFEAFRAQAQIARASGTDTALYEEALALYIGDLLPADRYEEWTEPVREELKTLHNDLLMELSQLYESQGKIEPAVERLERLLKADPVREEAHRGLMRLFALSGSRDKALRQYQKCAELLRRELGMQPSEEIETLRAEIAGGRAATTSSRTSDSQQAVRYATTAPGVRPAMEPRIQYARASDSVSIAFWTIGKGTPFVHMPAPPASHIQLECQIPEVRRWYERLAERHTLVHYDCRGSGLSERDVSDFSIESHLRDLDAVVDRLGLSSFVLAGGVHAGPVAVAYAARNPERVSHLVLWCTYGRASDLLASSPALQAVRALMEMDWVVATETIANIAFGWSAGEDSRRFAEYLRQCTTQRTFAASLAATNAFDVSELLPELTMPVLVLHRRQLAYPHVDMARRLASQIPNARLVLEEGTSIAPYLGDADAVVDAIEQFLSEDVRDSAAVGPPFAMGNVHIILFTDVQGSTSLTQRIGDDRARTLLRQHERMIRQAIQAHDGREVKAMGDAFLASFTSPTRALDCAIAIQRAFGDYNESAPEPIRVRVGLNAGEPIVEDMDLFGDAVNLAARIVAQASGCQILVSEGVRQLVSGKKFTLADRGETLLRGFEDPVRLYELQWRV